MPNFAYTNTTQFRPFSFEEQLRPLLMYTQAHQAVEEAYSELDSQANAIGSLANEANDPVTYQRYKAYESALRTQADALAKNGLTPGIRQSLMDLKGRYVKDIIPIQNAITRRRELADEQRKAEPTMMFQRDMNSMSYESSLDRFLENPNYDYGKRYSGALLTQQVGQAAANIAKELRSYSKGKPLDGFTKTWLQQHGYTAAEVAFAINHPNDPRASSVLNTIVDNVMADSGVANWADNKTMKQAYKYARQGLWQAVGQTQVGTYVDEAARMAADEQKQIRVAKKAAEIRGEKAKKEGLRGINPTSLYTASEKNNFSNVQKNLDNWIKQGYLGKKSDGSVFVTKKGLTYANEVTQTGGYGSSSYSWKDPYFRNFLREVGAVENKKSKTKWIGSVNAAGSHGEEQYQLTGWNQDKMNKYMNMLQSGYDTNRETEFVHDYGTSTEQDRAKDMIRRAAGNGDIQVVSYKGSNHGYTYDSSISKENFVNDYTVLASKGSKYGQVFIVEDKDGKQYNIRVPEVHREHQAATYRHYIAAEDAYKNIVNLQPQFNAVMGKINSGTSWENLTNQERKIITDYYSYTDIYEDMLWKAESEQGNITRGYNTDNLETE